MNPLTPPPGPHPEEYELADYLEGAGDDLTRARVARHIATCRACAALLGDAGARPAPAAPELGGDPPSVLLPESFASALENGTVAPPAAGQLWRVRAPRAGEDEAIEIVAIVTEDDGDVLVAPVTADPEWLTDRWTAHLPLMDDDQQTYAVWLAVAHTIAIEALDVLLGSFDADVLHAAHRAVRRGLDAPAGLVTGSAPDAGIREYRQALAGALATVAEYRLIGTDDHEDEVELAEVMGQMGWTFVDLVQRVGMVPGEARAVAEGRSPLAEEARTRIVELTGVPIKHGGGSVPRGWQLAVATPLRRHRFENVARLCSQDPFKLRADVAASPVAARNSAGTAADWESLVEQRLMQMESEAGVGSA